MTGTPLNYPDTNISLPQPMTAIEQTSWAFETVTRRWPEIIHRIFVENDLKPSIRNNFNNLLLDIPDGAIRPIEDPVAPDVDRWNLNIRLHTEKNWLEPPWFFTEHYFYRRVLEAIGYFQFARDEINDPFSYQKKQGLVVSQDAIKDLAKHFSGWNLKDIDRETLIYLLYLDLWGNQADLSMWPAEGDAKPNHDDMDQAREYLLEDRTADVADFLIETLHLSKYREGLRIDFMIDNAGFELVCDLVLADFLLSSGLARIVRFHVKPHPTYVSDAMIKDVRNTLDFFDTFADSHVKEFGSRLAGHIAVNRLQVRDNFFWTSPLPGWDMPHPLKEELSQSNLVISKGDANYRRLLGDLNWPYITPFADILAYFPAPVVALRTCKAEIICGMLPGQTEVVDAKDPNWMIDGQWGVVQFSG